jgi:hypothetical protein
MYDAPNAVKELKNPRKHLQKMPHPKQYEKKITL